MSGGTLATSRTRLALYGAASPEGALLREALAEAGVAGSRVDLYGSTGDEAVLAEYDGEARLIHEPPIDELGTHDVVFLCERGPSARGIADAARPEALVVDLVDALDDGQRPPVVHPDLNPEVVALHGGRLAIPHPLSVALAELLHPVERETGVDEAVAVLIRPAADFGDAGIEELRQQTVCLLNFVSVPTEVFGRQLAFNLIPHSGLDRDVGLDARVRRETASLLGWQRPRATASLVCAPLFHGHGIALRLRTRVPADAAAVREILGAGGEARTPMDVTGDVVQRVADVVDDGIGGCWIWAVAGENPSRGARLAVRLLDLVERGNRESAS